MMKNIVIYWTTLRTLNSCFYAFQVEN